MEIALVYFNQIAASDTVWFLHTIHFFDFSKQRIHIMSSFDLARFLHCPFLKTERIPLR